MVSHKKVSGFTLSVGEGGVRFKKKNSAFNVCIGKAMKGSHGGRMNKEFHMKFASAAKSCARVS